MSLHSRLKEMMVLLCCAEGAEKNAQQNRLRVREKLHAYSTQTLLSQHTTAAYTMVSLAHLQQMCHVGCSRIREAVVRQVKIEDSGVAFQGTQNWRQHIVGEDQRWEFWAQ